jgi:transcription initiation factor TFIIB
MVAYIKKCPECGGINLVLNKEKGEIICKDCGLVIEEKMIDFGQEWREFDHEQADKRRRTGAPMTYSVDANEPLVVKKGENIQIVRIGDFVDNLIRDNSIKVKEEENGLEYVEIDDNYEAVSFDKDYAIGFREIREVSRHPTDYVYEIKLETGRKVSVTGAHSIFTVKDNEVLPIKVEDVKEGDFVVVPLYLPNINIKINKIDLVEKFVNVIDKDDLLYLRGFNDESFFESSERIYGKNVVKNWRRHNTVPLWALRNVDLSKINYDNLKIGIYSSSNEFPVSVNIDTDFCRLLGFYAAEGHCTEHDVVFSFGEHEREYIDDVKKIINEKFGLEGKERHNGISAIQIEFNSKILSLFFKKVLLVGDNVYEKRVPNLIYLLPDEMKMSFLEGYVNGDGFCLVREGVQRPQVCVSTNSVSGALTNDVIVLYSQLRINANYQEVFIDEHLIKKTGQVVKGSLCTRSFVTNPDNLVKLGYLDSAGMKTGKGPIEEFIPYPMKYKKDLKSRVRLRINKKIALEIAEKHNDLKLKRLAEAPFMYLRVVSKKRIKPTNGFVYDISVPECENFVGGRGGIFLHNTKFDRGLGTDIGQKGDVYKLSGKERNKFFRLRKWQYRISTAIERNLKLALAELKRVSSYLKLPKAVEEEAARIYTMAVQRGLVRGRSMESVVAGALYASCRRHEIPRTLDELSEASGIDKKEIGRTYRFITRELAIRILPSNPVDYLPRFASALKLSASTQSKAVEILEMAQKQELTSGRGPTGIAAASLYVAALINDEKRTQREVADIAGVTEVTIRNRYKELLRKLKLKDKIKVKKE